ncbi:MAG: hypothetical protein IPK62_01700 [Bacteroidetes bacterium]|nr:hypothetical protein [Bacteroidota bacterium]
MGGSDSDYAFTRDTATSFVSGIKEERTHSTSCFGRMPKLAIAVAILLIS